jgi:CRISPR-associated protein Cas2
MKILITYDIKETKTRNKIVKILERYSHRIQKSVFYFNHTEILYKNIKRQLEQIEIGEEDSIFYFDSNDKFESIKNNKEVIFL